MKRALIAICMLSLIGGAATWAVAGDAKAPDKPIELKSSEHKKMWVKFNHATHESVECDVCHHAAPSDAKDAYVSCGASEEPGTPPSPRVPLKNETAPGPPPGAVLRAPELRAPPRRRKKETQISFEF